MTSKAPDVQSYMREVPDQRLPAAAKTCLKYLKGFEECMDYGMPWYKRNGLLEIAFANQKNCIALYVMKKDVVDEFRSAALDRRRDTTGGTLYGRSTIEGIGWYIRAAGVNV